MGRRVAEQHVNPITTCNFKGNFVGRQLKPQNAQKMDTSPKLEWERNALPKVGVGGNRESWSKKGPVCLVAVVMTMAMAMVMVMVMVMVERSIARAIFSGNSAKRVRKSDKKCALNVFQKCAICQKNVQSLQIHLMM